MIRIDKNIKSLVLNLNKIQGVWSASSCGGHKNPKGSRAPEDEFWIILQIWNPKFLIELHNFCYETGCEYHYNKMHETWAISWYSEFKEDLEKFVEIFINDPVNVKNENEWDRFYSYGDWPENRNGFKNQTALEKLKEYAVLHN